ncbi:MAG: hypothetical protein K2W95_14940 [Candidatus Obscuribacterales bacterium]|nr:hypothetical protein [Candidatus Obscuribacterales bacterium]
MGLFKRITGLIDTVNSWEEGIALSVMITGGGCAIILLIYLYSNLYKMVAPEQHAQHHRPPITQTSAVRPPIQEAQHFLGHFGRPRDLDSRGSEARAASVSNPY